ncbi:MAG: C40 family peptidase [Bacteroidales bacterium]|jgi:cell wall-associated NlpC family hydrolase|nr:C40 family peptidase [Bacteroidales bacterium]
MKANMQTYRIAEVLVPMRKEPSHKSEMINEIIFGEPIKIIEKNKDWLYVNCIEYEYFGFIPTITRLEEISPNKDEKFYFLQKQSEKITINNGEPINLVAGSRLYSNQINNDFFKPAKNQITVDDIINAGMLYLNAPYRWGGRSGFGIDCSGFVQMAYMLNNLILPRDAYQQATIGETISFVSESKIGDLAFFENENGDIIHVGLILNNNEIIHSSGRVKIDILDHEGIFNKELKAYTHKLKTIKRINIDSLRRCC